MAKPVPPWQGRFWSKAEQVGDCWIWTASITNGYGKFYDPSLSTCLAHRISWSEMRGEIPAGLDLDHLCRVRSCINPDHLDPVTRRVNLLRGKGLTAQNAARKYCPKGHPYDKDNTKVRKNGRDCRTCAQVRDRKRRKMAAV